MPNFKIPIILSLMTVTLTLAACNKNKETEPASQQQSHSAQDHIGELKQLPIKAFPVTPDDGHDIAILDDYDQRFTAMSDSMEMELAKMKQDNTLTPAFEQQRQQDNINSALTMLKDLELKTEQGRYIQGLLADYWESQAKLLQQATLNTDNKQQMKNLNQYLHAQSQLHHWKSAQTHDAKMQEE